MKTLQKGGWLPTGKTAAVCFTIDDIHPGTSEDAYEAGGDLADGALGYVTWLLERHPDLWVTLFTTADWRQTSPTPTRKLVGSLPWVRDQLYLAPILPVGTMRLDRHPKFVEFLSRMRHTEIALHGLHHLHKGPAIPVEFQKQDREKCRSMLHEVLEIFNRAGLDYANGLQPPGWNLPSALRKACIDVDLAWVASARDIFTPITPDARTDMSGLKGASLIYPTMLEDGLVHFTSNFQATSKPQRAFEILENGGLLAIKAHIVKSAMGHVALDGVDQLYMNYLDMLLTAIERRFGDQIWWTSMGQIAELIHEGDDHE